MYTHRVACKQAIAVYHEMYAVKVKACCCELCLQARRCVYIRNNNDSILDKRNKWLFNENQTKQKGKYIEFNENRKVFLSLNCFFSWHVNQTKHVLMLMFYCWFIWRNSIYMEQGII